MIEVQVRTLVGEGCGKETNAPCRQSLREEFIERRVKERRERE